MSEYQYYEFAAVDHPLTPQQQFALAPVRRIHVRIKVALHPVQRVALEVAPVVFVDEVAAADGGAAGALAQLGLLLRAQGLIYRGKFVVLVFAHGGVAVQVERLGWVALLGGCSVNR